MNLQVVVVLVAAVCAAANAAADESCDAAGECTPLFTKIEGKVTLPKQYATAFPKWQAKCRVLVNHGEFIAFVKEDGTFSVTGVPVGTSYVVEVTNADIVFEPVRVDITSKGKMRARKLNLVQPSQVNQVTYPLRVAPRQPWQYFRKREEWRISDVLMNPMVLMMVVPMLIFMVLPKLINTSDPELQKEMQQSMQMPKYEMPELSEVMTNWFGGGAQKKAIKPKPTQRR